MDAIVCHDFGESAVQTVPKPTLAKNEVLLEVQRVQLSVTECGLYHGERISKYETIASKLEEGSAQLFGHEFCGVVTEIGEEVTTLSVGQRVYAPGKIHCNDCAYCNADYPQYCQNKEYIGYHRPGALAEYVALPASPLCPLPESVSDAEGAAMQPAASAALCVHDADISLGDSVAVIGCGVMGYVCAQLAMQCGADRALVVDVEQRRLELAEEKGLTSINAQNSNPVKRVQDATGGIGADVVIEAVGGNQNHITEGNDPIAQAYRMVRNGGTILQVGHIEGTATLSPRDFRSKSINWINPTFGSIATGPSTTTGELTASLVAQNRLSLTEYITHTLHGLESFEKAVEITANKHEHDALGPAQIIVE